MQLALKDRFRRAEGEGRCQQEVVALVHSFGQYYAWRLGLRLIQRRRGGGERVTCRCSLQRLSSGLRRGSNPVGLWDATTAAARAVKATTCSTVHAQQ